MNLPSASSVAQLLDRSADFSGQPFDPDTTICPPQGLYSTVHYGLMLPNLPVPYRFLNVIVVAGQPKVKLFCNPQLIQTTARDTASVLVGTSIGTPDLFRGYSISKDCDLRPDGSYLRFGQHLVLEGTYPDFSVRQQGHAIDIDLKLKATDKIAHFGKMIGGAYEHWSLLCEYEGTIEHGGTKTSIAGLCTWEYARAFNVNLPFRFFTYQILNIDETTQVLMVEVRGPLGLVAQQRVYIRSLDDHGGIYSRGFNLTVQEYQSERVTTPAGHSLRLPKTFSWRVDDDQGHELITIEGVTNGDFQYGMAGGYAGSYEYRGRFKQRDVAGTGYIEWIDPR
ncbi:MAG: hypothetical protein Q8L72_06105 [Moraxellaceae bacterium]|nr:hypothetical protein [Moraxellaceae bacterium]